MQVLMFLLTVAGLGGAFTMIVIKFKIRKTKKPMIKDVKD